MSKLYETVLELDLSENRDQDILKDKIVKLSSIKAIKTKINKHNLRLLSIHKADENKVHSTL